VRFDRKLLLIAPTIVLFCVVAGVAYAAAELHVLTTISDTWRERSDFVGAVERGEKHIDQRQALSILQFSLDVEAKRTAAITAARDLLIVLTVIGGAACVVLAVGVRGVPRQHWPRFGRAGTAPGAESVDT
jgi:hypothetical protein